MPQYKYSTLNVSISKIIIINFPNIGKFSETIGAFTQTFQIFLFIFFLATLRFIGT